LGVLSFAFGPKRYKAQAISLAQSIRLHNPDLRLACITDDLQNVGLQQAFDILVPFVPELGKALQQKLWFDVYTPFERTAFIDSDCLVVGSLQHILKSCSGQSFAPLGYSATSGWWYMQIPQVLAKYNLPFMPRFNGGYYYFEKSDQASQLFARARQIGRVHKRLGIFELGLWFNEEVFYALAMAWHRLAPVPDPDRTGMYTPDEFTEPFSLNVLNGGCHFAHQGQDYRPVIVHFFGRHGYAFQYVRERGRLRLHLAGYPLGIILAIVGLQNAAFGALVGTYRAIAKFRGRPLPFKTNHPVVALSNFGGALFKRLFEAE